MSQHQSELTDGSDSHSRVGLAGLPQGHLNRAHSHELPTTGDGSHQTPIEHVLPGDIIWFTNKSMHAHVQLPDGTVPDSENDIETLPDRFAVTYLDGYAPTRSEVVARETLDQLAKERTITCVYANIDDPEEMWELAHLTRNPPAERPFSDEQQVNACSPVRLRARPTTDALDVERVWSRDRLNGALEHPLGDHQRGRQTILRAGFFATRPDGKPCAAAVLSRPNSRILADGVTISLSRYISHPTARQSRVGTNNTASWLISRVASWARLEGFERLLSYSGVGDNDGTIYTSLPFRFDGWSRAADDGFQNRSGRSEIDNQRPKRKRWIWDLHDDSPGVTRRAAARDHEQETLSTSGTPTLEDRCVSNFALTREDHPSYHGSGAETATTPASPRATDLFAEQGAPGALTGLRSATRSRTGTPRPPAVIGADIDGTLIAAVAISGAPLADTPTATVEGIATLDTPYPQQTLGWLLSKARDWASLAGYRLFQSPDAAIPPTLGINPDSLRQSVNLASTTILSSP